MKYDDMTAALDQCMTTVRATGEGQSSMGVENAYIVLDAILADLKERRGAVYLIGNGASAAIAAHTATDLNKACGMRAHSFGNDSWMTAIANDQSYVTIFSTWLDHCMNEGDMLIAISSSGESPNVLRAVREARKNGRFVLTLSAFDTFNTLRSLGMLNLYVSAQSYGLAETCHAALLHHMTDRIGAQR